MIHTVVPVAPPPNGAEWISSLSTLLMVSGIVLVMCALPPVRRGTAAFIDKAEKMLFPPRKQPVAATAVQQTEPATESAPEPAEPARREIDEFDLSLFED